MRMDGRRAQRKQTQNEPDLSLICAVWTPFSDPPFLSAAMSKTTERFSLYGDERKEMSEAEEAYKLHSTAMNPDFRLQPVIGTHNSTHSRKRTLDRESQSASDAVRRHHPCLPARAVLQRQCR